MLHLRGDAIWSKGRAQSIHEDNEKGGVIYQRKVESEASDIPGRHFPHAHRQGCIEIDLTGDSSVPEKSGLDTVGREAEVGTHKECGVSGIALELGKDGSDTPRKEESAAARKGEDICPRKLDTPGDCTGDQREGFKSSVENTREKGSMDATTEDRSYSSEGRQYVHKVDNTEEEGSAIAHSNTECIGKETEQPRHYNTDGTSPGRTEHGCRCTQPDGEKAGLCTERGESRRDITNNRTENTGHNLKTNCAGALWKYLETILREKEEREKHARRRDIASPSVLEKYWTCAERENEGSAEGSYDSDSASLAGANLDPATAAWAFDKDPGDLSGVRDTGSKDEKGRLEITPRRSDISHTGEESIQGMDLFKACGEYVRANDIAAAILKNQKSERDTWRVLRRFRQFIDRESMDDTYPLTSRDAKWIMEEFFETQFNTNVSSGVIHQTERKVLESINLFRETKIDRKDIEIFLKTYVGDKPRRGKRCKTIWDLTIITKWEKATHDMTDQRTLQRRALILTMVFGALRPSELERMRSDTTIFKDEFVQTQVQTKTSGGETVKVIINKHPNPRIYAVIALQRWMEFSKTTLKDEHVWFNISERQSANLQKIKEELVAVLRENGITETFTAFSKRHAVITHLARQQDADWKTINADARWVPSSRVAQEYYTVLPVQDTRWFLETIGGSGSLCGEAEKSEKDRERKDKRIEKTVPGIMEYTGES
ncbi:uncharacterized protein MONOS_2361 [Monocercomonoides exilis]|uniref:uncharacterized protein n=1 Tax=Monocercomonoides exilis TaxID=2049356 RepID=UPI0035595B50|nr:hypothetical protein MONOS_2361 [Monocercomonoides exilis]|eukprot:MONOS_2361.1-p1 / transcript=MONOS_2361.1 / gene=MONOS_2361 / organism=Monocercomonoides_exilis_PA203 / gene_product=unspecified product / transcript_product=unspecified product / location=Mono_scaffold00048:92704-95199(-) / protein_length=716 / sequence_SO=supercontig / SO=protein_coding / is_pseudo=false